MTTEHADIQSKLEKLLRLAARAGTPEEAAAAAGKAAELALKHGIDLNRVNTSEVKFNQEQTDINASHLWVQWIASSVATLNACRGRLNNATSTVSFVGRMHNAMSAKVQFEYIIESIGRFNREAVAKQNFGNDSRRRKIFRDSFRTGAAQAMANILRREYERLRSEGIKDQPQANALVVANYFDQEQALIDQHLGTTRRAKAKSATIRNNEAYMQGAAAATKISLNKQVDMTPKRQLT